MYEPGLAGRIANACAVLHNMRIHCELPEIEIDQQDIERERLLNICNIENEVLERGNVVRARAQAIRIQNSYIARQYGIL